MNNRSLQILNRRLEYLRGSGCNFQKLHEYFGYRDTETHIRKISLKRDPYLANIFTLIITQKKREISPLQTYMDALPRDVNNLIYSYLHTNREIKYIIELPANFPFHPINWTLLSFEENGVLKSHDGNDPNNMYCGSDFSPAMTVDAQILLYLSSISWFHDEGLKC